MVKDLRTELLAMSYEEFANAMGTDIKKVEEIEYMTELPSDLIDNIAMYTGKSYKEIMEYLEKENEGLKVAVERKSNSDEISHEDIRRIIENVFIRVPSKNE